jgi:hypothetical protein
MLELTIACTAFALLGALPPNDRQRARARTGSGGRSLSQQLSSLRQVGLVRRR